jgi:hypothetical protein
MISVFRKQKQENLQFKASLSCVVRLSQKNKSKTKKSSRPSEN